jgi:hypothetical protein
MHEPKRDGSRLREREPYEKRDQRRLRQPGVHHPELEPGQHDERPEDFHVLMDV